MRPKPHVVDDSDVLAFLRLNPLHGMGTLDNPQPSLRYYFTFLHDAQATTP